MTIQIELWHILTLAVSLVGAFWALVKVIVVLFNKGLDVRFKAQEEIRTNAQEEWKRRFGEIEEDQRTLETRFNQHLQRMPLEYQRREDAIRQEVAIINRLDGVADLVEQRFQLMDQKIGQLRSVR